MGLSEPQKVELRAKHGDGLISVDVPDGSESVIVFRRPQKMQWVEFQDKVNRDRDSRSLLLYKLVLECAVWPGQDEVAAILDRLPAFPASCSVEIGKLAGQTDELNVKKL